MTKDKLLQKLNTGRLSKNQIEVLVKELMQYPNLTKPLLKEVFRQDKLDEFNASWVFDHLMRKRLVYIVPHLELFTLELQNLTSESCRRPMAHTCELITEAYFQDKKSEFFKHLTEEHLDRLATVCFDWLIGEHKVATKVFAMTSLYYLGLKFDWIHSELKMVIETTIAQGTAGYKSRGGKILDLLND